MCTNLFYVDVPKWTLVKPIFFLAWHVIGSLLHKEESSLIFLAKKLICIVEKSVPQTACLLSEVKKYTAEPSFRSSRNTLSRRVQIKRWDRRHSFSMSLNFYRTILESSPQTRFMFDIKKLLLIDALTFIPGETQDDPLRIAIDLPEFGGIPKAGHITDYSKTESAGVAYNQQRCVIYSTTQFLIVSLCCVSLWHEINLLRCSFS